MKCIIIASLAVSQFCLNAMAAESVAPKFTVKGKQLEPTPLHVDADQKSTMKEKMKQQQQVDFARAELAERLGVELEQVSVTQATAVTWRSGALGCPAEGRVYTQALVPGVRIILSAQGESYSYHASQFGRPFSCSEERAESPAEGASGRF
ncbi:hypothetical protein [Arenicella xantha]|uniref:Uncharacterized protein n=1 Tax=Arenicella xantha TaxID=644221 RepID=A0A395JTS5_9GAMM|nr:hypothetical protein [Arenicella xantha]RBP53732.1 hypothetical protein DFR28_1011121 [Arenicella xantha]